MTVISVLSIIWGFIWAAVSNVVATTPGGERGILRNLSLLMKICSAILVIIMIVGSGALAASYNSSIDVVDTSFGCVNTRITEIHQPSGPAMVDGGRIAFAAEIGHGYTPPHSPISGVYIPPGSYFNGKHGDRVRVCLLTVPKNDHTRFGCNPTIDPRGREFLVYDRVTTASEVFGNGEHGCGGA